MGTDVNKNIALLTPRVKFWKHYDQFLGALIEDLLDKAKSGNEALANHIASIIEKTAGSEIDVTEISQALQSSKIGLEKVEGLVARDNSRHQDIMALLGLVRSNLLLTEKLKTFKNMIEEFQLLYADDSNDSMKSVLLKYGHKLQGFWQVLESHCGNAEDKQLIRSVVNEQSKPKMKKAS